MVRVKNDGSRQFATRAIHAGQEPEAATGAITVPIYQTSTFAQSAPGVHKGYDYSRTDNPTRTALQTALASLESAEQCAQLELAKAERHRDGLAGHRRR